MPAFMDVNMPLSKLGLYASFMPFFLITGISFSLSYPVTKTISSTHAKRALSMTLSAAVFSPMSISGLNFSILEEYPAASITAPTFLLFIILFFQPFPLFMHDSLMMIKILFDYFREFICCRGRFLLLSVPPLC